MGFGFWVLGFGFWVLGFGGLGRISGFGSLCAELAGIAVRGLLVPLSSPERWASFST